MQEQRSLCRSSEQEAELKKAFIVFASQSLGKQFTVDAENKAQIQAIFSLLVLQSNEYTINDDLARKMALSKGFFVCGDLGTGKSTLMRLISEFKKTVFLPTFRFISTSEVCQHYKLTGSIDIFTYNDEGVQGKPATYCFDELGREPKTVNNYGTSMDVMSQVLQDRYLLWQKNGTLTHFVTNMSFDEIKERYGEFIQERIVEMCNVIAFKGKSRRY